jgi:hypothetical protein
VSLSVTTQLQPPPRAHARRRRRQATHPQPRQHRHRTSAHLLSPAAPRTQRRDGAHGSAAGGDCSHDAWQGQQRRRRRGGAPVKDTTSGCRPSARMSRTTCSECESAQVTPVTRVSSLPLVVKRRVSGGVRVCCGERPARRALPTSAHFHALCEVMRSTERTQSVPLHGPERWGIATSSTNAILHQADGSPPSLIAGGDGSYLPALSQAPMALL